MKVYILYASDDSRSDWDWVEGVYSTHEKAEKARKFVSKRFRTWIEEESVIDD